MNHTAEQIDAILAENESLARRVGELEAERDNAKASEERAVEFCVALALKSPEEIRKTFSNLQELIEASGFDAFEPALEFVCQMRDIANMADSTTTHNVHDAEAEAGWHRIQARLMGPEHEAHLLALRDQITHNEQREVLLVGERDEFAEAVSQIYFIVFGQAAEWSNNFGTEDAVEAITDAVNSLKQTVTAGVDAIATLRAKAVAALEKYSDHVFGCGILPASGECTCGLDAALAELRGEGGEG